MSNTHVSDSVNECINHKQLHIDQNDENNIHEM